MRRLRGQVRMTERSQFTRGGSEAVGRLTERSQLGRGPGVGVSHTVFPEQRIHPGRVGVREIRRKGVESTGNINLEKLRMGLEGVTEGSGAAERRRMMPSA